MREFFQEKLQVPVEYFNPLRNVAVAESARVGEISQSAHLLGELVGLALRTATTCPMELNLRPEAVVRRQELEKRRPYFIMAAACFILAILGWGIYYTRAAHVTQFGGVGYGANDYKIVVHHVIAHAAKTSRHEFILIRP